MSDRAADRRAELRACEARVRELQERVRKLEKLAAALDSLLAHYRTGTRPGGTLLDRIGRLRQQLYPSQQED